MYMYLYIHVASVGNDDEDACALLQAFWAVLGVSMLNDQVSERAWRRSWRPRLPK